MRILSRSDSSKGNTESMPPKTRTATSSPSRTKQPQSAVSASSIEAASGNRSGMPRGSAAPGSTQKPNAEAAAKLAALQKSLAFTQIVSLMMRSPQHRAYKLADLEWLFLPALQHNQFRIAEAKINDMTAPAGFLLWATVSPEVDKRLSDPSGAQIRLKPEEWRSGDIPWVIETVGDPRAMRPLLKAFRDEHPLRRSAKVRTTSTEGKVSIVELGALNLDAVAPTASS